MSLDGLMFLLENYWPFLLGALLIGLVTGWLSTSDDDEGTSK